MLAKSSPPFFLKYTENTCFYEPSFKGLLVPFVSTFFWKVSVQCGLFYNHLLRYKLLFYYYTSSTLPSRFTLAVLEIFRKNRQTLAELNGNGQPITMYAPFVCI